MTCSVCAVKKCDRFLHELDQRGQKIQNAAYSVDYSSCCTVTIFNGNNTLIYKLMYYRVIHGKMLHISLNPKPALCRRLDKGPHHPSGHLVFIMIKPHIAFDPLSEQRQIPSQACLSNQLISSAAAKLPAAYELCLSCSLSHTL